MARKRTRNNRFGEGNDTAPDRDPFESPKYKIYLDETTKYAGEKLEIFKIIPTFLVSISTFMFGGSIWSIKAFGDPKKPWILVATWICLALSLSLMMLELLFSLRAYEKAGEIITKRYLEDDWEKVHKNIWSTTCEWIQYFTFGIFIIGVFSFLVYFSINLFTSRSSNDKSATQGAAGNLGTEKPPLKTGGSSQDLQRAKGPDRPAQ